MLQHAGGVGRWLTPKITFIASGSAIEKPMKEPKVTMYSAVIDQVCLSEDGELLGDVLLHRAEGGQAHDQQRGDDVSGIATTC